MPTASGSEIAGCPVMFATLVSAEYVDASRYIDSTLVVSRWPRSGTGAAIVGVSSSVSPSKNRPTSWPMRSTACSASTTSVPLNPFATP